MSSCPLRKQRIWFPAHSTFNSCQHPAEWGLLRQSLALITDAANDAVQSRFPSALAADDISNCFSSWARKARRGLRRHRAADNLQRVVKVKLAASHWSGAGAGMVGGGVPGQLRQNGMFGVAAERPLVRRGASVGATISSMFSNRRSPVPVTRLPGPGQPALGTG